VRRLTEALANFWYDDPKTKYEPFIPEPADTSRNTRKLRFTETLKYTSILPPAGKI
jgi:hypothetical protein